MNDEPPIELGTRGPKKAVKKARKNYAEDYRRLRAAADLVVKLLRKHPHLVEEGPGDALLGAALELLEGKP